MGAYNKQANVPGIEDELIRSIENLGALKEYENGDEEDLTFPANTDPDIIEEVDNLVNEAVYHVEPNGIIRFRVAQTHDSLYALRHAIVDYAIQTRITFRKNKNQPNRLMWRCTAKKCPA